ncbi:helix-turn-helix transcriptional regulator [Sphingomonas sp. CD22]|uniref:helix-turn-helix domain-containing protein n=1 Tax=Sphingomonas sp. CD22 TaxID=3100214 RepID=UPI002ADF5756|nr:helix-turn-helix transcriptional regulator [Sphingomonas sp. CD22]MEA1086427.1 helix-turn-helix transcriptional regulator [Sphingomonas sp. CD22]
MSKPFGSDTSGLAAYQYFRKRLAFITVLNIFAPSLNRGVEIVNNEAGVILANLRGASGLTQRQVAERMSANQTRVSRIEAGDGDDTDIEAYVTAVGTPEAQAFGELLRLNWTHLPRPSLRHPDLGTLVAVEHGLDRVRAFLEDGQVPTVLAGQAQLLDRRLEDAGRYLLSLDHEVVYVGEIGVGKTTAACRQAGLVLDGATAADLKGMLLDTGGGRTTLCDVRVETGEKFALTVEPVSDEEIYKLVSEVCKSVFEKLAGEASATTPDYKPAEEVERALRNMAGLPRPARARKGATSAPDPASDLATEFASLDAFTAEFAARLSLWRRSRRSVEFDGIDARAGRQWLRSTFIEINNGRHDDFSLPARITVTVPFALVGDTGLSIAVIDTRGVDVSAVRPDILAHMNDPRAVTLLCSKWGSAPDPSSQALLTHITETNADAALLDRVSIVALARVGDALSMRQDSGESAEDRDEGYDIKLGQVDDALQKIGLAGIEAFAFDASADEPNALTTFVLDRIASVRRTQAKAAEATIAAIDQMIDNRAEAEALAALSTVSGNLDRFANRQANLRGARRPAYERLLTAVTTLHARTIWAATRRAGRFWNFDAFQYLGDGAAAEAKVRSSELVGGLIAIIDSDLDNIELVSAQGFLMQVRANVAQWEADFVNAARHHAAAVYFQPLSRAQELWDACESEYGLGMGAYREGVAGRLRAWFEERVELREELERRVARAWITSFIAPLKQTAGQGEVSGTLPLLPSPVGQEG